MTQIQAVLLTKFQLSPRQLDVAGLAHKGMTNIEIADKLFVTDKTVKFHMGYVFKKCGVGNRKDLIALIDKLCKLRL